MIPPISLMIQPINFYAKWEESDEHTYVHAEKNSVKIYIF